MPKRGKRLDAVFEGLRNGPKNRLYSIEDPTVKELLAEAIIQWPIVESDFVRLIADLMGAEKTVADEVFYALISQKSRIAIARHLLQHAEMNRNKEENYDHLISEFERLNKFRNRIVHSYWITDTDTGKLYTSEAKMEWTMCYPLEEIHALDILSFIAECDRLRSRLVECFVRRI